MVGLVILGDDVCEACGEKASEHCDSCGVGLCDECAIENNQRTTIGIFCGEECWES